MPSPRISRQVGSGEGQRVLAPHQSPFTMLIPAAANTVAAAAAAKPTAAAAATASLGAGLGFVYLQSAAIHVLAVQGRDGGLGLLVGLHLHKAEALGASGIPIHDDLRGLHG